MDPTPEERIAALETELATERGKVATFEAERTSWDEERAVHAVGITDPEAIGVARHFHAQLPEKDRPALATWVSDLAKDVTKAPRALQPYLPTSTPSTAAAAVVAPAPRVLSAPRPSSPASGAASGSELSAEQARARIADLATTAQRTGNWKPYDAERPTLLERISRG